MRLESRRSSNRLQRNIRLLRGLIWVYFLLLIFEGFLRMLLPSLSNALLVVRDPVLLLAYLVAQVSFLFPWNRFLVLFVALGIVALGLGYFVLPGGMFALFYGFRCSFLHVPLIFLIPQVMDEKDVARIGRWFLILSIPIAVLMSIQFSVGPDHWLNRGLDNQFSQIGAEVGRIRPPGTFTAVTGPVHFYAFVVAFLLYGQFQKGTYSTRLAAISAAATCLALTVSISRSALASVGMVILTSAIGVALARPQQSVKFVRFAILASIAFFSVSQLDIFNEGADVFTRRIVGSTASEGGRSGVASRFFGAFDPISMAKETPLYGEGLGRGTNAGNVLYAGRLQHVAEYEWARVIFELGPILGMIYVLMRIAIAFNLLRAGFASARSDLPLSLFLAGACWFNVLAGTWQQTTALGFAILGGGLCLAASNSASHRLPPSLKPPP